MLSNAVVGDRDRAGVSAPQALRHFLESRGPMLVCLGQHLGLRPDRLPEACVRELLLLEEATPPMAFDEVRRLLDEEAGLGKISASAVADIEDLDPVPIRSTVLWQTHAARFRDEAVAIKFRRPGASQRIADELRPQRLARELARAGELPSEASLAETLQEIREDLLRGLDLTTELLNLQQLHETEAAQEGVPLGYPELSSDRVLTRQRFEGTPLTRLLRPPSKESGEGAAPSGPEMPDRERVARSLVHATVSEIFGGGLVNRFWHPDNILARADGSISLHDYAWVGTLGEDARAWQLRLFDETLEGDPADMFQVLGRELDLDPASEESFRRRFIAASREWDLGKRGRVATLTDERRRPTRTLKRLNGMMKLLESEGTLPPGEFIAVQRHLAGVEAICWNLAPKADLRALSGEPLGRLALNRTLERLQSGDVRPWLAAFSLARNLPESLNRILRELSEGKLPVQLSTTESERTRRDRNRRTRLLAAALGTVGLAVLVAAPQPLALFGLDLTKPLAVVLGALYLWLLVEGARRR